jgi:hypothetical protein
MALHLKGYGGLGLFESNPRHGNIYMQTSLERFPWRRLGSTRQTSKLIFIDMEVTMGEFDTSIQLRNLCLI